MTRANSSRGVAPDLHQALTDFPVHIEKVHLKHNFQPRKRRSPQRKRKVSQVLRARLHRKSLKMVPLPSGKIPGLEKKMHGLR